MNSDQDSHFTSPQYTNLLHTAGVQISMDGRRRALDNIFTERLWRTVKYNEVAEEFARFFEQANQAWNACGSPEGAADFLARHGWQSEAMQVAA